MSRSSLINFTCLEQSGCYIEYSQGNRGTHDIIKKSPLTADGICQALSAKWIAQHANDDSLWNWLFLRGTTTVNKAAVVQLMHNYTDASSGARFTSLGNPTTKYKYTLGLTYQDYVTDRYLELYDVKRRQMVSGSFMGNKNARIGTGANGFCLANRLHKKFLNTLGGSYVLIVIKGQHNNSQVGHAMAAYVGSHDVTFFDPNYGEFWFPSQDKFTTWFTQYWSMSEYDKIFKDFYLVPYGKAM